MPATQGGSAEARREVSTQIIPPPLSGEESMKPVGSHPAEPDEKALDAALAKASAGPIPVAPEELAPAGWKREQQLKLAHHYACPLTRGDECSCAANLIWLDRHGLRKAEGGLHPALKWDAARDAWVEDKGDPSAKKSRMREPRVICHGCGWSTRGENVHHFCNPVERRIAGGKIPIHLTITQEERFGGRYRLVFYRRKDMDYDVVEELLAEDGKSIERSQLLNTEEGKGMMWDEVQGLLQSEVVERFTP